MAIAGTLSSGVFLGLATLGATKFHRDARRQRVAAAKIKSSLPVSLLKPVHGLEARLKENIESFFQLDDPEYEILFVAAAEDKRALAVVREVCPRYPQICLRALWLYLLRDLLGFFVWCASYGGQRAVWRNIPYKLAGGGRIALRGSTPQNEPPK
jgi:cellulose synthase/poly-beta-1,6-N-acetylglucosamine synthase-like glycosyltransferase